MKYCKEIRILPGNYQEVNSCKGEGIFLKELIREVLEECGLADVDCKDCKPKGEAEEAKK